MGTRSIVVQRIKRRLDLLPLNLISSYSSLRGSSTNPEDCNFFKAYEFHLASKSFSYGYLKTSIFAENRNVQIHIRPLSNLAGRNMSYSKIHKTRNHWRTCQSVVKNNSISAESGFSNDAPKPKRNKLKGKRATDNPRTSGQSVVENNSISAESGFSNDAPKQKRKKLKGKRATDNPGTTGQSVVENTCISAESGFSNDAPKQKRKKLKGKRAVVKWLKFFRWKKKKEYERMTSEEKILFKLKKARKKEERLVEALKKIEPNDSSVITHDPEVLTPEEHFYLLKLGKKCKNYVPVGRRGIFQGVILNMHLHWKKHQTLQVIVKTFTSEEVREIAVELARLTGGIVLHIGEDNTIIMYRGKNYSQPPAEIMSPKVTLPRKKALDKSKYRDAIHALRRFIPKLEQDLEDVSAAMKCDTEYKHKFTNREENPIADIKRKSAELRETFEGFGGREDRTSAIKDSKSQSRIYDEDESSMVFGSISESEQLSDIFETESDEVTEDKNSCPLYLDEIERFPSEADGEPEDFQEHLRQISAAARRGEFEDKDLNVAELDHIDKIFLRASSLLKKRR